MDYYPLSFLTTRPAFRQTTSWCSAATWISSPRSRPCWRRPLTPTCGPPACGVSGGYWPLPPRSQRCHSATVYRVCVPANHQLRLCMTLCSKRAVPTLPRSWIPTFAHRIHYPFFQKNSPSPWVIEPYFGTQCGTGRCPW